MTDEENQNTRKRKENNEMNSRDELLQSLYGAKKIIEQAEEITRRYQATKSKLLARRTFVPGGQSVADNAGKYVLGGLGGAFAALVAGISVCMGFMLHEWRGMVSGIGFSLLIVAGIVLILRRNQRYWEEVNENRRVVVAKQNEEIARYNAEVQREAEEINREMMEIREIAGQRLNGWYPPDYMYSEAAAFFIGAIQNFKANNMQEAVNLFDKKIYEDEQLEIQRGLSELQRQQNRLQKMQNVISAVNVFANLGTAFNTGRMADDVNSIKNSVYYNYNYYR